MSEHVCEDNIEDSYENFDIVEADLKRAMPIQRYNHMSTSIDQNFNQREEKPTAVDYFDERLFANQNKVALNSDVDLIKTNRVSLPKSDTAEDDKVSGEFSNLLEL